MLRLDLPESIETNRLLLQRLRYEDAEEIFFVYASKPEATKFLSWPTHNRIEDTRSFLQFAIAAWSGGKDYSFSIRLKENGQLIGSFGIINDDGKLQFGYVITPTKWNQGFATEVVSKMMTVLKQQSNIYRISTFVDADNVPSQRVLLHAGLVEEGRLEKWFRFINQDNQPKDCILYKLPLQ